MGGSGGTGSFAFGFNPQTLPPDNYPRICRRGNLYSLEPDYGFGADSSFFASF